MGGNHCLIYLCTIRSRLLDLEFAMNTGQIKRIGKRTYCVIGWTDHDVTLQSMDEEKYIVVIPRTRFGGLKTGQ